MFNPKKLSEMASQAVARIEEERQRESQRIQMEREEAEAKQLFELARQQKLKAKITKVGCELVKTAIQGRPTYICEVNSAVTEDVKRHFQDLGYNVRLSEKRSIFSSAAEYIYSSMNELPRVNGRQLEQVGELGRLARLVKSAGVDNIEQSCVDYVDALETIRISLIKQQNFDDDSSVILNILSAQHVLENVISLDDGAMGETSAVEFRFQAVDATCIQMDDFQKLPFWLLSTGGSGLIKSLSDAFESDAGLGHFQSILECIQISKNSSRWGENDVHKVVHCDTPIGVWLGSLKNLIRILEMMGFVAEQKQHSESTQIRVGWGE
jgi:hypothetical protein